MTVNIAGLSIELTAANIPHGGCHSDGRVWDVNNNEIQTRPDVAAVIAAHNAAAWAQREQRISDRNTVARAAARNIPSWATWTQEQFDTWCTNNLMSDAEIDATSLSAAIKKNIKANNAFTRNAGKMLIAMRDQIWPDLPE